MASIAIIALLNFVSGIVALLISYYAYKNNRLVGSILLRYISWGFLLLGVGLILQAGTESVVGATAYEAVRLRGLRSLSFLVYTSLEVIAYAVFAWGYGLSAFVRKQAPSGAAVPVVLATAASRLAAALLLGLAIYVGSQVIVLVLLLLIVIHGVRVFTHSRSNLALMVLFGFSLIFLGHVLMITSVLGSMGAVFLVGNTIEFLGFFSLLIFLIWSGRVVK